MIGILPRIHRFYPSTRSHLDIVYTSRQDQNKSIALQIHYDESSYYMNKNGKKLI